ncbi:MAG: MFS transporter, partial [Bacteroidetes bacterium]|nr:MFS transporter [Bacteroidota bacterium]
IVVLAIMIGIAVLAKLKPVVEHLKIKSDKNAFKHLLHTLANKNYQTGFLAIMFLAIGGFMLMPFSSSFLVNNVHISQEELPWVFMFTGISSIIIMPLVGKLSDKIDKFKIFAGGSFIAIIMCIIYTQMGIVPLWQVIVVNVIMFMGIMGRMIPASIYNTSIPNMQDRGAYMSITASLQQMAGGLGAVIAGLIVYQKDKTSPLEHFDTLGYVVSGVILVCIYFIYRVSVMIKAKGEK